MEKDLMKQIRAAIEEQARIFFSQPVEIEERTFQALECTDVPSYDGDLGLVAPSSLALLARALVEHPSIGQAIEECGVSLSHTDLPRISRIKSPDFDPHSWFMQFEAWFLHIDRPAWRPTHAYRKVQKERRLSVVDAILGCLQSRYLDDRRGRRGDGCVSTNDVVGLFARKINAEFDGDPRGRACNETAIDHFCSKLSRRLNAVYAVDPSAGSQQFILYSDGRNYRIRPFGSWGTFQLQDSPLPDGSLWVARTNVLQPLHRFTPDAIDELEGLVNRNASERSFQAFFECHPEFSVTLGDYKAMHPQLVLHEDQGGRLIPDFFLEKLTSDFCDICDLKRPTAELVNLQRHRVRFRDAIQEAIAQLAHYRDWFEDRAHREAFKSRFGLQAYRPRVVLVVGRSLCFYDEIQRMRLEAGLPSWVTLRTYDEVVAKARLWARLATLAPSPE
jgi:hypothetical protein